MRREMRSGFSMKIPTRPSPIFILPRSSACRFARRSHRLCRFACRRNKGNKGNSLTRPMRSHFCYFCYFCGTLLSHAESFYCPAVIGFAASLVEEIKEIKEIFVPTREAFLLFLLFLRDLKHASWLDLFYYPKEMKEIKEILLPSLCEALSAISALSAGNKHLPRENRIVPQK